jgi:hypothetical protein
MPPRRAAKDKIPDVPWAENGHHLIWLLLGEIEKDANYKVLFGKKDSQEVINFSILRSQTDNAQRTPVASPKLLCISASVKSSFRICSSWTRALWVTA